MFSTIEDVPFAEILADLLEYASEMFSNHTCNDYAIEATPEALLLYRAMHKEDGYEDDDAEPTLFSPNSWYDFEHFIFYDASLMNYFAKKLREWADEKEKMNE